jgi:ABC-type branched-subunit amino acid transport system ATPase component
MNSVARSLIMAALLLLVVAPFAGLAPLLFVLLFAGIVWIAKDWLRILWGGASTEERDEDEKAHSS